MSMDLASLDALTRNEEEGRPLQLKHPITGDPIGLTLHIAGATSSTAKKIRRRQLNEAFRNQRKALTAEMTERNAFEQRVELVLGWTFEGLTIDGQTPDFSRLEVEKLIRRFEWIGTQIDDFASDQVNFMPA